MPEGRDRIRPFRLSRDLGKVAALIEEAFGDDIGEDRLTAREVFSLRILSPIIWLLGLVSPSARDIFSGLVYVRDGRIAGNVTISRFGGDPLRWLIGNVAVSPAFQRQGIARKLMHASLATIRQRGGELAILDVRSDNVPALGLYEELGFKRLETSIEMRLDRTDLTAPGNSADVKRLGLGDVRRLLRLQRENTPLDVQELMPVRETAAMTTLVGAALGPFGRIVAGRETAVLSIEENGELTGVAEVAMHDGQRGSRIQLTVLPGVENVDTLVSAAVRQATSSSALIRAEAKGRDTKVLEALSRAGFVTSRSLIRMVLSL